MEQSRNACMLQGKLAHEGYDWWWHSFLGRSASTGELRPFFIEYFLINPVLGRDYPILGQCPNHVVNRVFPSYGMLKAGSWGAPHSFQVNNFYGIKKCHFSFSELDVRIGDATLTEQSLAGEVSLSEAESRDHPEFMSQAGSLSWELKAKKLLSYDVGVGASKPVRDAAAFQMFWHVQGMKTEYEGTIRCNGELFVVEKETCAGYQDKNWGSDFTNPWVWLNCNRFFSNGSSQVLPDTSLDVGGGTPVIVGVPIPRKLLIAFSHNGKLYEFHFLKLWKKPQQKFLCFWKDDKIHWQIEAENLTERIEILFFCPVSKMLRMNYENPRGQHLHRNLWNGGHAEGTVRLFEKERGKWVGKGEFRGEFGGCEYGVY